MSSGEAGLVPRSLARTVIRSRPSGAPKTIGPSRSSGVPDFLQDNTYFSLGDVSKKPPGERGPDPVTLEPIPEKIVAVYQNDYDIMRIHSLVLRKLHDD